MAAVAGLGAQTPPASRMIGEVTAASKQQLTVKADKGESVTVMLEDKTLFLRVPPGEKDLKKAARIAAGDIGVGDRVLARGALSEDQKTLRAASVIVMTKADLAQKHEHDRAEWQKRGVAGVITALNPESKQVTIAVRSPEGVKPMLVDVADNTDFRRYAPDSVRFSDAKPSSFAELQVGDHLRVLGEKNQEGTHIRPEVIVSGSFRTLAGTVSSLNAAAGELKITDLETHKPLAVRVNTDTMLRRMPPQLAGMMARRMHGGGEGQAETRPVRQGQGIDFQQVMERIPALTLAELKPGDAVIISSTRGADPSRVTAIALVAGVEPLLTAAPQGARQIGGAWNFDIGMPE